MDAIELSNIKPKIGDIYNVKILGALPMVDDNEMDWKILTYEINECNKLGIRDLQDYIDGNPKTLSEIITWFKTYKAQDKKYPFFLNDEQVFLNI